MVWSRIESSADRNVGASATKTKTAVVGRRVLIWRVRDGRSFDEGVGVIGGWGKVVDGLESDRELGGTSF
jgi:hypothetical protein